MTFICLAQTISFEAYADAMQVPLNGYFEVSFTLKNARGSNFKAPNFTLHPCVIADSTIYFSSFSGEICKSKYENGVYEKVEVLKSPINYMNLEQIDCWGDPFVSPDESLMIFRSNRRGGYGGSDLYIVFSTQNGNWSTPQNLGPKINSSSDELGGDITPDGKYLTFSRDGDIYWVSTNFINEMRKNIQLQNFRKNLTGK